jgi:O-acetyl-ADP-ribose deacetylase (regulator of RNase III)
MSFSYYSGSVFECADIHQIDMIVNTVNCKGFMGAGIALEYKLRFPNMFNDYSRKCLEGSIKTGHLDVYAADKVKILNFPTKDDWKKPSNINWIKEGLHFFVNHYKKYNIHSIAFPKLGTHNGGLEWNKVKKLMEEYLGNITDLTIYVCLDEKQPEGTEGRMLDIINNTTIEELKRIGLRTAAIDNLMAQLPLNRFFMASKIKALGIKTYEKLHNYCYQKAKNISKSSDDQPDSEQMSLF